MSTAVLIIGALQYCDVSAATDAFTTTEAAAGATASSVSLVFVTSQQLHCALAPRLSAAAPLSASTFELVASAPTAWCTADLRVHAPTGRMLGRLHDAFPQLRRLAVTGKCCALAPTAAADLLLVETVSGLNRFSFRELFLGDSVFMTDGALALLAAAPAATAARLETLHLANCDAVTDAGLSSLGGSTRRLRVFAIGRAYEVSDHGVAAALDSAVSLQSVAIDCSPRLTGHFLACLPDACRHTLRAIRLVACDALCDEGVAHLDTFSGLESLTLAQCPKLTQVPALGRLQQPLRSRVVSDFFADCDGLTAVDLSPIRSVDWIGSNFLRHCGAIEALDLAPLRNVVAVGDSFLLQVSGVSALDLTPLRNLRRVGGHFLNSMGGLTELDLTPVSGLRELGTAFVGLCTRLTKITFGAMPGVAELPDDFLQGCCALQSVDLSAFTTVTVLGDQFLGRCRSLSQLDLSPLRNVRTIGRSCLVGCTGLQAMDLAALGAVTNVGSRFAAWCSNVKRVRLSPCLMTLLDDGWRRLHAETAHTFAESSPTPTRDRSPGNIIARSGRPVWPPPQAVSPERSRQGSPS